MQLGRPNPKPYLSRLRKHGPIHKVGVETPGSYVLTLSWHIVTSQPTTFSQDLRFRKAVTVTALDPYTIPKFAVTGCITARNTAAMADDLIAQAMYLGFATLQVAVQFVSTLLFALGVAALIRSGAIPPSIMQIHSASAGFFCLYSPICLITAR